jgi:hypothetical protein
VVAILSRKRDQNGQTIARHVNERADREFRDPAVFARYWAEAGEDGGLRRPGAERGNSE